MSGGSTKSGPSAEETLPASDLAETLVGPASRGGPSSDRKSLDRVGRYLLLERLGRGANGEVYAAYDRNLDRRVAVKILASGDGDDEAHRERLLREAKAMARIDHRNVIAVHDAGVHEGRVFIAMALASGMAGDAWLAHPRSQAETLTAFTDAARGLAAAHAVGVVHRDFKPANMMVTDDGHAKVGDFGLAGFEDASPAGGDDVKGSALGTPAYMSPEHWAGEGVDARSDQFSFCAALHEGLYGERPFRGTTASLAAKVIDGKLPAPLLARRGRLAALIRRGLSPDPAARLPSMDAVVAELEQIQARRWPWALAAVGLAAVMSVPFTLTDETSEPCQEGRRRVDEIVARAPTSAGRIGGDAYTRDFIEAARDRYRRGITSYAEDWAEAYAESCPTVGRARSRGTPAQRAAAECLENRLESLRGLVELPNDRPVDAERIATLLGALPSIDVCASGWDPYPSDPEEAARVGEVLRERTRIHWARLAGQTDGLLEQVKTLEVEADALSSTFASVRVRRERARLEELAGNREVADALLDEAMTNALAAGLDHEAALVANDAVVVSNHRRDVDMSHRFSAVGRGLAQRLGDEDLLGDLSLNECLSFRLARRFAESLRRCEEARQHFETVGSEAGISRARSTRIATLVSMGDLDRAIAELEGLPSELSAPDRSIADALLVSALLYDGRIRDALRVSRQAVVRARAAFAPGTARRHNTLWNYVMACAFAGELEEAAAAKQELGQSKMSDDDRRMFEAFSADLMVAEGRLEEAAAAAAQLRNRALPERPAYGWASTQRTAARIAYIRGDAALAAEILGQRSLIDLLDDAGEWVLLVRLEIAGLALLVDAPDPDDTTWRTLLDAHPPRTFLSRVETQAARAASEGNRDEVKRVRDQLAAATYDGLAEVRILDAWLARADSDRPER